jgi:hypothetical protein
VTLKALPNVISSPGSADGHTPSGLQAGRMTGPSGLEAARANRSLSPGGKAASTMTDTFGLFGRNLSASDALQQSLENNLRRRLNGSPLYAVTWKPWNTPWGQSLWKPRASARTISGTVIGLWPTLTTPSGGQTVPPGTTLTGLRPDGTKAQVTLNNVVIAVYSTLRASDGAKGGPNQSFGAGGCPLPSQVSGIARSSNAPMENGAGSLHPEFGGWVMGYPPAFLSSAASATRLTQERRRNSSKRRKTP